MNTLYDTKIQTTDQEDEKTEKIKTEATRELWEAEMMTQCNQNFMKYVKNEFKTKLIQFRALSTISFEEMIEKAVQLENATTTTGTAAVNAATT